MIHDQIASVHLIYRSFAQLASVSPEFRSSSALGTRMDTRNLMNSMVLVEDGWIYDSAHCEYLQQDGMPLRQPMCLHNNIGLRI